MKIFLVSYSELEKLRSMNTSELKANCKNLKKKLQNGLILDIDNDSLFNELKLLQKHLSADRILNFLKIINIYPVSCIS